jgi:hypothetical protein
VKRGGFEGSEISSTEILDNYLNKEIEKTKGMAFTIRYFNKI